MINIYIFFKILSISSLIDFSESFFYKILIKYSYSLSVKPSDILEKVNIKFLLVFSILYFNWFINYFEIVIFIYFLIISSNYSIILLQK